MIIRLSLLLATSIYSNILTAQNIPTLSGQFKDTKNTPLDYLEVVIMQGDSLIAADATDKDGKFKFSLPKGRYNLIANYFGNNILNKSLNLSKSIDLGTIVVDSKLQLDEIVVSTKKPLVERKVDRLVFNVDNSIAATGGNGLDALKLTPRIKVQNDEISMIGKSKVGVMINGRILQMTGEELSSYLKSLSSDNIKKIEVISNPPAKYSAEGNSGLVNIVLKESRKDAWNASIRNFYKQATYAQGIFGGNFNLQRGKFQLNTSINYINGSYAPLETNDIFYKNSTWRALNNRRVFSNSFYSRFGLDYLISDKLTTGFTYNFVNGEPLAKEIDSTKLYNPLSNVLDSIIVTKGRRGYSRETHTLNYHFIYDMDTMGRKLSLDFDFLGFKNKTNRLYNSQSFDSNNQPKLNSLEKGRSYGNQEVENYSVNIDMEHPTLWANYNYGLRVAFTQTDNLFDQYNVVDNKEVKDKKLSNVFNYKENTQALYFSIQKRFSKKWETKVGLRYEFTQTKGFSKTLNRTDPNDYSKLFPTFYLSYNPNDNHSFSANYGRRIRRPNFWYLNPFRITYNAYSYTEGNTDLQPAFTDNIELEYAYNSKFITKIYFSNTDDDFEYVSILNTSTKIQEDKPLNFIVNKKLGISQAFILKPMNWWNINASVDVYYSDTDSKAPSTLQFLNGWTAELYISNDIIFNKNKTLLFNTNLWVITNGVDNLDYSSSDLQLNASLKWFLLNKNLVISLNIQDIINPKGMRYTSYSNGIKNSFKNYFDEQYFRIGLIYNFGKKFKTITRENKNQEEQNRINVK